MGCSKSNLSIEISVHQAHFFPEVFSAVPFEEGSYPVGVLSRIATDKRMNFLDSRYFRMIYFLAELAGISFVKIPIRVNQ